LIQTGGSGSGQAPSNGMKNWSADTTGHHQGSTASLSNAARRLASANNLETLMRSLSNNNTSRGVGLNNEGGLGVGNDFGLSQQSNANLQSLLQNMSNGNFAGVAAAAAAAAGGGNPSTSMSSLLGANNGSSAASLANLFRDQSSTGLSALRMQDGLNHRNTSVEDFLSLVAAGDIPHQDPSMLNLPLSQFQQQHQQQQIGQGGAGGDHSGEGSNGGSSAMAAFLAQQHALAQATGTATLANALSSRSFGNLGGFSQSHLHGGGGGGSGNLNSLESTAELLQQMAGASSSSNSFNDIKRKLLEVDGGLDSQGPSKR
jgi:hypothetical protein